MITRMIERKRWVIKWGNVLDQYFDLIISGEEIPPHLARQYQQAQAEKPQ